MTSIEERILPPQFVYDFLLRIKDRYPTPDSFIVYNKNGVQCQVSEYFREFKQINEKYPDLPKLDFKKLRDTFVVRSIRNGLDLFTVAKILGMSAASDLLGRYCAFFKAEAENICRLEHYADGTCTENNEPHKMNPLILRA